MPITKIPPHLTDLSTIYGFGPVAVGRTDVDFNSMTEGGIYSVPAAGSSNGPYGTGANAGYLQVMRTPGGSVRQIWRDYDGMEIWERYLVTDTWSAWERTYVSGASLLEAGGYQKLPSGLIMQWGLYSGGGANPVTITFPIAFPTACLNVQLTPNIASAIIIVCGTKTAADFAAHRFTTAGADSTANFLWSALGY